LGASFNENRKSDQRLSPALPDRRSSPAGLIVSARVQQKPDRFKEQLEPVIRQVMRQTGMPGFAIAGDAATYQRAVLPNPAQLG
jgi:hypothetical protein